MQIWFGSFFGKSVTKITVCDVHKKSRNYVVVNLFRPKNSTS